MMTYRVGYWHLIRCRSNSASEASLRKTKERRQPRGIIKRAILKTLEDAPEGMDALSHSVANAAYGSTYQTEEAV